MAQSRYWTWVRVPALPLCSWVTLGNSHSLSKPQFSLLQHNNYNIYKAVYGLPQKMYVKMLDNTCLIVFVLETLVVITRMSPNSKF